MHTNKTSKIAIIQEKYKKFNVSYAVYQQKLSELYQDPFVSIRERNHFSAGVNEEVRQVVEGAVFDARRAIGDTTGYLPHVEAIEWWADETFRYGAGPS